MEGAEVNKMDVLQSAIQKYKTELGKDPSVVKMSRETGEDMVKDLVGFKFTGDKARVFGIPVEFVSMPFDEFAIQ